MNLCYEIASRIYRRKSRNNSAEERSLEEFQNDYWMWQYETSEVYFPKFGDLLDQVQGKSVLDIGCGLGGRTAFLSAKGVDRIVGTDVNHAEVDAALRIEGLHKDKIHEKKLSYVKVSEKEQNSLGSFDIVLLIDSMEHVRDPLGMLNYAYSVTKPGGICYFSTLGWYNHMASHLGSIVPIPFATVFFSDKQILDAVKRIVQEPYFKPSIWDTDPPIKRWEKVVDIKERPGEYLNKITVAEIRRLMSASKFENAKLMVRGFNRIFMRPFNLLSKVPIIQESYHSGVFGRLQKSGE